MRGKISACKHTGIKSSKTLSLTFYKKESNLVVQIQMEIYTSGGEGGGRGAK